MNLVSITDSTKTGKKLMALFDVDGKKKTTHFGADGMDDYTLTHDKRQREQYRSRHAKDLQSGDPSSAGFLSYYILWGDSVSRQKNISEYKKKFGL